ncbi:MAG: hypothetical protein IPN02_10120 [Candidatus Microthrix sp.]|uniref:Uncharacterized protein n=1 Tax=Candidatus Neomicrothrix subdominans TaxID=2954438 RepID=A0A936NBB9_9ACTN|nr:hypothetical protein [Candidatus Microthrix subdominans]
MSLKPVLKPMNINCASFWRVGQRFAAATVSATGSLSSALGTVVAGRSAVVVVSAAGAAVVAAVVAGAAVVALALVDVAAVVATAVSSVGKPDPPQPSPRIIIVKMTTAS